MSRIIGGSAGGRRLKVPAGERTRPTSDRVREALFSALESALGSLQDRPFLDLYAGSGAIAFEAASRGAGPVVAVESDRRAAAVIGDNVATTGLGVRVVTQPVERFVTRTPDVAYDVVVADPPYPLANDDLAGVLAALLEHGWLAEGATVVVERSARTPEPAWPAGLVRVRRKDYGETVLWYVHADTGSPVG
jgi:16S rRNA (guanine966-N2)-methyltransferase